MCTINQDHMVYGSQDMEPNKQNFLWFWAIFFPFYTHNGPKNQDFEKMKNKYREILF